MVRNSTPFVGTGGVAGPVSSRAYPSTWRLLPATLRSHVPIKGPAPSYLTLISYSSTASALHFARAASYCCLLVFTPSVTTSVASGVGIDMTVGWGVSVGVDVGVKVGVCVGVCVGVRVDVGDAASVGVAVGWGVGVGTGGVSGSQAK